MSALHVFSDAGTEAVRLLIMTADALCAVAESEALAGMAQRARESLAMVGHIMDEASGFAAAGRAISADEARELLQLVRAVQHRARNMETVVKLLEECGGAPIL